jgi:hypothetical protein
MFDSKTASRVAATTVPSQQKRNTMLTRIVTFVFFVLTFIFTFSCSQRSELAVDESPFIVSTHSALTCSPVSADGCCVGTTEQRASGKVYGSGTANFMGYQAHSNGKCTGGGSGAYQCAVYVQGFYRQVLEHAFDMMNHPWVFASNALNEVDPDDLQQTSDPVFVFKSNASGWNSTEEPPRATDAIAFDGGDYGHIVIAEDVVNRTDTSLNIPIIEQNVAMNTGNGPGGSTYHRVLVASKSETGMWNVNSGLGVGYTYQGFIRHNLAGIYGDTGWHDDGTSQAFRMAYMVHGYGTKLGWAFDNGGTPFVHQVGNIWLQDFVNTNPKTRFGTDGQTAVILNDKRSPLAAYVVKEGFWGAYKCLVDGNMQSGMGGVTLLGAPKENESVQSFDQNCNPLAGGSNKTVAQRFENGCLWWGNGGDCADWSQPCVHVHSNVKAIDKTNKGPKCTNIALGDNPPGQNNVCTDECAIGEQRCLSGSSTVRQFCGKLDSNTCRTWMNQTCSDRTVCSAGNCVSPPTGGSAGSAGGSGSQSGASVVVDLCTQGDHRCVENASLYQACIRDSRSGIANWELFTCPDRMTCVGNGECREAPIPSPPDATGGSAGIGGASDAAGNGGTSANGGSANAGGISVLSGSTGSGGLSGSGGWTSAGGSFASGGSTGFGGMTIIGGSSSGASTKFVTFQFTIPSNVTTTFVELDLMTCATYTASLGTGCSGYTPRCITDTGTAAKVFTRNSKTFSCTLELPVNKLAVFNYDIKSTVSVLPGGSGNETWACRGDGISCNDPSCWRQFGEVSVNGSFVGLSYAANNGSYGCNYVVAY